MHETKPELGPEPESPKPKRKRRKPGEPDGRSLTSAKNGAKGGHPRNEITATPPEIIEGLKSKVLSSGQAIKVSPLLGMMTKRDENTLMRICKMTVEEFNASLAQKLGVVADELADSILQDVRDGKLKPGEKAFPLAIAIDKRNVLDGRSAIAGATVNLQVNNFNGPISRDDLMKRLAPTNVTPSPAPSSPDSP